MAQPGAVNNEIDLISDTQQPLALEKLRLHANHNIKATSLLLADILQQKPLVLYMLGMWWRLDRAIVNGMPCPSAIRYVSQKDPRYSIRL